MTLSESALYLFPASSLPPALPTFHPKCKMIDGYKLVNRGLRLEEIGLSEQARAIAVALEKVQRVIKASQGKMS